MDSAIQKEVSAILAKILGNENIHYDALPYGKCAPDQR
jgi:hypothetical protein